MSNAKANRRNRGRGKSDCKEVFVLPKDVAMARWFGGVCTVWRWLETVEIQQEYGWHRVRGIVYLQWVDVAWADLN